MSTPTGEKFKEIRLAEDLNQKDFAEKCGMVYGTYRNYESNVRQPNLEAVQKVCAAFPQYTMYLMFDEMPVTSTDDQLTPEEKKLRDLSTQEQAG
ncbi:MAG: helix-turn-helix transcriptional regulator [Thiotrichales bacterium]|nr:helix-turn-helix transcriptional regulator [Thiotrichales bacterium]